MQQNIGSPSNTPLSASIDYSSLMAPPICHSQVVYRSVQTDLTINKIKELESKSALDLEMRDNRIEELQRVKLYFLSKKLQFYWNDKYLHLKI